MDAKLQQAIFNFMYNNHDVMLMDDDFNCIDDIIKKYHQSKLSFPSEEEIEKTADKLWPAESPSVFIAGVEWLKSHLSGEQELEKAMPSEDEKLRNAMVGFEDWLRTIGSRAWRCEINNLIDEYIKQSSKNPDYCDYKPICEMVICNNTECNYDTRKQSLQPKEMECPRHIGEPMIGSPRCAMDPKYYSHTSCFHFDLHQGRNHCCCEEYNSVTCTGSDCGFFKGEGEI